MLGPSRRGGLAIAAIFFVSSFGLLAVSGPSAASVPAAAPLPSAEASALAAAAAALAPARAPSWHNLTSAVGPPIEAQESLAYDPGRDAVIFFGGTAPSLIPIDNYTWAFHAGVWTNISAKVGSPPEARWGAKMVFDPAVHGLVLFGGRNFGSFFNDTWTLTSAGWQNVTALTPSSPSPRSHPGFAYDPQIHAIVLFGGGAIVGSGWVGYNDTWEYYGSAWHNITSTLGKSPAPRFGADLVYQPSLHTILLVGGGSVSGGSIGNPYNQSWLFRTVSWVLRPTRTPGPPPGPMGGEFCWDNALHLGLLFAGNSAIGTGLNTTWTLSRGTWTDLTPTLTVAPPARNTPAIAYDASDHYAIMVGGNSLTGPYLNDTWAFY